MNFLYVNGKTIAVNVDRIAYIMPEVDNGKPKTRICFSGNDDDYIIVKDRYTDITGKIAERMKYERE